MPQSAWTAKAGQIIEINGTQYYHYEFEVGRRRPVKTAVEAFKRGLLRRGVPEEKVLAANDKPRTLERMLDETMWLLDVARKEGIIPRDHVMEGLVDVMETVKREKQAKGAKARKKLHAALEPHLKGQVSKWFDVSNLTTTAHANDTSGAGHSEKESGRSHERHKKSTCSERDQGAKSPNEHESWQDDVAQMAGYGERTHTQERARKGTRLYGDAMLAQTGNEGWHEKKRMREAKKEGLGQDISMKGPREGLPRGESGAGNARYRGGGGDVACHQSKKVKVEEDEDASELCARAVTIFECLGDLDEAERLYQKALSINGSHVDTLCNYALLLELTLDQDKAEEQEMKDLERAGQMYLKAATLKPNDVDVLYQRALFLKERQGDMDAAEDLYKRILEIDPQEATTLCNYGVLLHHHREDHRAAEGMYLRVLALDQNILSPEEQVSTMYSYALLKETHLRDPKGARLLYEKALAILPNDSTARAKYALSLQTQCNNTKAAEGQFKLALSHDPDDLTALTNYALFLQHTKRYDEAHKYHEKAVELAPDSADCLCNLAQFLQKKRRKHKQARKLYRAAIRADPTHVRALCNYGVLLGKQMGEYAAAQEMFERAIDADPKCQDAKEGYMICVREQEGALVQDLAGEVPEMLLQEDGNRRGRNREVQKGEGIGKAEITRKD